MINYDDGEHNLLSFYNIKTLTPQSIDDVNLSNIEPLDDLESLEVELKFDLLNSLVKYDNGPDNTYEEDYEDPLRGHGTNVIKQLIEQQIISSKNDPTINEYIISSRYFNSQKFLTTIHKNTSIDDLTNYLKFLEQMIQNQQNELKQTIDDNYINFVNCKRSIDDILAQFKTLKTKAQQEMDKIRIYNPKDRNRLKGNLVNKFLVSELEESIKNLTLLTNSLIRPIEDNKAKENKITKVVEFIKKNKFLFDLPSKLMQNVKLGNHDEIVDDLQNYTKLKQRMIEEDHEKLKIINSGSIDDEKKQSIFQDHQVTNTLLVKIFNEVDNIVEQYRRSTYNELLSFDHEINRSNNTKFLSLVDKIDQLNGESLQESPINTFLISQLKKSNKDLDYQFSKFEDRFTSLQKKLMDYIQSLNDHRENGSYVKYIADKYKNLEEYFKASSTSKSPSFEEQELITLEVFNTGDNLDLSLINEAWLVFLNFVNYLSDVYLKNIDKFVASYNYYVKNNKKVDENGEIQNEFIHFINVTSDKLFKIFKGPEDTTNQLESSPKNYSNILPYYTNSLSTIFYISRISERINVILTNFGKNITEIGNLGRSTETNKIIKNLRSISNGINQIILEATCAVWVNDCSQFYDLENWEVDTDIVKFGSPPELYNSTEEGEPGSSTKLISIIEHYTIFMLRKIKNLMFINNLNLDSSDYVRVVTTHPSKKMLVSIEIQFVRCLNILTDSIMKKYNLELQNLNTNPKVDEIFKVLTMNNFDKVSRFVFPTVILSFDKKFEKDLLSQNLKLFSDIERAGLTILDDILSKEKYILDDILTKFFIGLNNKSRDNNSKPEIQIHNFIYEILIHFVKLVYNIKPITNKKIFSKIINDLQNFFLMGFLDSFRQMQTTVNDYEILLVSLKLDIDFFIEVFEPSELLRLNDYCYNLTKIIRSSIEEKETKQLLNSQQFDRILEIALENSNIQFNCLAK